MTSTTTSPVATTSRTMTGIACVLIGMLFFAAQDTLMKAYLGNYTIWMLLFMRSCMAVAIMVPLVLVLGKPHLLRTRFLGLHCLRGALFGVGFAVFYMAFPFMGLAEATTIFFSAPLMIAVLAVIFLKERIGKHRIGALILGFIGVLIAVNPTGVVFSWITLLPLLSALFYAMSQILARLIGDRESSLTVGLYTLVWSGPVVLIMGYGMNQLMEFDAEFQHMRWAFPTIGAEDMLGLISIGLTGLTGYVLLSRAYQVAEPSKISLFDYCYLPMATTFAWVIWAETPPLNTVIGMVLVIGSGVYIGLREMHNATPTEEPAPVSETLIAPGNPLPGQSSGEDTPS